MLKGVHALVRRPAIRCRLGATARSCEQFMGHNKGPRECINVCMRVIEGQ